MQASLRGYWLTLFVLWVSLSVVGIIYSRSLGIPASIAAAAIPAFLVEAAFYLAAGFEAVGDCLERRLSRQMLAVLLSASALVPYVAYSLPAGSFRWAAFASLAGLAVAVSFWYVLLPRSAGWDLLFLALVAGVIVGKVFSRIYLDPAPRVTMSVLGHLMWIRLSIVAILRLRRAEGVGFGFLPTKMEWVVGVRHYLYFLPLGVSLALATGLFRFAPAQMAWWKAAGLAAGTFLGMLWVVALSEEFFFRGLLQQWLGRWLSSPRAGLALAALLFGLAHLPFRSFPNWRFAVLASIAGWFYGRAYAQAGSIRAAMVAHALTNTTWRLLFS